MPTFSLTDNLNNPVDLPVKWTGLSALYKYLKSEALHLMVFPDVLGKKDLPITAAAPKPLKAQLKAGDPFQLGSTKPAIKLTPVADIELAVNATAGADLCEGAPFAVKALVPANVAYTGLTFDGSLDLGVSGTAGDLTFGFDQNTEIKFAYFRAFPCNGPGEPTLGEALSETLANFVIPGEVDDLALLRINDLATVSGTGCLKVCGGVKVAVSPNPLASVSLPLNAGSLTVQEGVIEGLTVTVQMTGSYQVRVRRLSAATIELSFLKEQGRTLTADLSGSAGVSVEAGGVDLVSLFLGAVDPKVDHSLLMNGGLSSGEIDTLSDAIKSSINHCVRASFDASLSEMTDGQAAFQYQIDVTTVQQDGTATDAIGRALHGDLSMLTALEPGIRADGTIAPGVRLTSSIFSTSVKKQSILKVNFLGLVNVLSLSNLLRGSNVVKDPVSGDLTITDSATGTQINSIVAPLDREAGLRKAMFESLLLTAAYRTSGAVAPCGLSSSAFHFAVNQDTDSATMTDYLNWFVAFGMMTAEDKENLLRGNRFQGPSTCLIRTALSDAQCRSMFFDEAGNTRAEDHYLDFGRRAIMALLSDKTDAASATRYKLLAEHWPQAVSVGASDGLAQVAGITTSNPDYQLTLSLLIGDVYDITWWASAMLDAGKALAAMNRFLSGRDPASLRKDPEFDAQRVALQKKMAGVIGRSKARFAQPWGLLSLYWTAGSAGASGTVRSQSLNIAKGGSIGLTQHA